MTNEKHVNFLIKQIRYYLDELESEINNRPGEYIMSDKDYEQVKYYYSHVYDDEGGLIKPYGTWQKNNQTC